MFTHLILLQFSNQVKVIVFQLHSLVSSVYHQENYLDSAKKKCFAVVEVLGRFLDRKMNKTGRFITLLTLYPLKIVN